MGIKKESKFVGDVIETTRALTEFDFKPVSVASLDAHLLSAMSDWANFGGGDKQPSGKVSLREQATAYVSMNM